MGFDTEKFNSTKYTDRLAEIEVPELAKFFEEADAHIWVVKCVGANEIAKSNDAAKNNKELIEIVTALAGEQGPERTEAIKEAMGITSSSVQTDVVRRISLLVSASVDPICDQNTAVRISNFHGNVFYRLTNKILSLIGEGMVGE